MPFKKYDILDFVQNFEKDLNRETYLEERHKFSEAGYEPGLNRLERIQNMPYVVLNKTQREESYYLTQTKIYYEIIDEFLAQKMDDSCAEFGDVDQI